MATERQYSANRANALKSTGPRTEQGRARSSMNALKHGLTAQSGLLPGENADDYERLECELAQFYRVRGVVGEERVRRAANLFWRLRRLPAMHAALVEWVRYRQAQKLDDPLGALLQLAPSPLSVPTSSDVATFEGDDDTDRLVYGRSLEAILRDGDFLAKLTRYETSLVGLLEKELAALERYADAVDEVEVAPVRVIAGAPSNLDEDA